MFKTVLVIDDHSYIRVALRKCLEEAHLEVCGEAADGSEAIKKATKHKPGLILMDVSMPNMNGVEAASAIRALLPETRIVLFTLFSDVVGTAMAKATGVDLVISKGDGAAALTEAISDLLANSSGHEGGVSGTASLDYSRFVW